MLLNLSEKQKQIAADFNKIEECSSLDKLGSTNIHSQQENNSKENVVLSNGSSSYFENNNLEIVESLQFIIQNNVDDDINDPDYIPEDTPSECNNILQESVLNEVDTTEESSPKFKRRRTKSEQNDANREKHPLILQSCGCRIKCYEKFNTDEQTKIHNSFWNLGNDSRRIWLDGNINIVSVKRRNVIGIVIKRQNTHLYHLPKQLVENDSEVCSRVKVCQKFFLRTLGYTSNSIINSLKKGKIEDSGTFSSVPRGDMRGRHTPHNKIDRGPLLQHIQSFQPKPSHYRREHAPNRLYLPPDLSARVMYGDYILKNPNQSISYDSYRKCVTKDFNISFYESNAETCGFCIESDINASEENQTLKEEHIGKADLARKEYDNDANDKIMGIAVYSADMQKVVLLPRMPKIKDTFFKPRLIVFNETFASMKKSDAHYYILWHEAVAGRTKEEVSSAFIKFFRKHRDTLHIILWMDNCSGQNKNFALYTYLIIYINSPDCLTKTITLKYLVPGHTYMSADGLHGNIEQRMRKCQNIYDFDDFIKAGESSSKRAKSVIMEPNDFYHVPNAIRQRNKGKEHDFPLFKDIVYAQFTKGSLDMLYKNDFSQTGYKRASNIFKKKTDINKLVFDANINGNHRGISETKKKLILCKIVGKMPENRRAFWNNLPSSSNSKDLLDDGY